MELTEKRKAIQSILGVNPDGVRGPKTQAAWDATWMTQSDAPTSVESPSHDRVDDRSESAMATLEPSVRPLARALVRKAGEHGIAIKIIDGSRTYAEQDALYAKGRSAPGSIVTNARGGQSWHNFGLAFDIGVFEGSKYIPESAKYRTVGNIGKSLGFEWGGDWQGSLVDEPHFQFNPKGYSLANLRRRKADGLPLV